MTERTFTTKPAVREQVPLLISLTGPSGAGKTFTALSLATGIQRVAGGEIFFIDTEARRALHYAEQFKFQHLDFGAPFGSLDYLAAIEHCVSRNAKTIIVDSMSHEHEGPGGLLETHEAELTRMAGQDYGKRNAMQMLAWQKPKQARRRLLNSMVQLGCNVILCFRAGEKSKPGKDGAGKKVVIDMGFTPIAGPEFVYEMTLSCLLLPRSNGVPTWDSDAPGERMAMKLPGQFSEILQPGVRLDADVGVQLAQWAQGGSAPDRMDRLIANGRTAAMEGSAALQSWWASVPAADKAGLKPTLDGELKPQARAADQAISSAVADPEQ